MNETIAGELVKENRTGKTVSISLPFLCFMKSAMT